MPVTLLVTLTAVFISIALASGAIAARMLARTAPGIRRLQRSTRTADAPAGFGAALMTLNAAVLRRSSQSLRRPRDMGSRLQRRLALVGWDAPYATTIYSTAQFGLAAACALPAMVLIETASGWPLALLAAVVGYMLPDMMLSRQIAQRRLAIQNGLPDALDLMVVCLEAGSSLEQAIVRTSEELEIAVPPMASELRTVATEIRAGKPRIEAFQNFAKRANLDDVRSLVSMLIHTDRFGTSIAQALRTHSDMLRTQRRQRAEERAGKVGVKLVFPLVLCMLPALYIVCLGPVAVRMYHTFF
jgi:tight adherence protein C